jgi:hypothetical protein
MKGTYMRKSLKSLIQSLPLLTLTLLLVPAHPASAYSDPGIQRWINRDPVQEGAGANVYTYSANDPGNRVDPSGFDSVPTAGGGRFGDCTKAQHHQLHDAASRACKASGQMTCFDSDDCATIKSKIAKFDACIRAKEALNDTCFSSESSILNHEVKNYRTGRQNCQDKFCAKNCK